MCRYGEPRREDPATAWDDPFVRKAAELLVDRIGTNGLFAIGRPITAAPDGYRLEVIGAEVTNAVAVLLRHVEAAGGQRVRRQDATTRLWSPCSSAPPRPAAAWTWRRPW